MVWRDVYSYALRIVFSTFREGNRFGHENPVRPRCFSYLLRLDDVGRNDERLVKSYASLYRRLTSFDKTGHSKKVSSVLDRRYPSHRISVRQTTLYQTYDGST